MVTPVYIDLGKTLAELTEKAEIEYLFERGWQHNGTGQWFPPGEGILAISRRLAVRQQVIIDNSPFASGYRIHRLQ